MITEVSLFAMLFQGLACFSNFNHLALTDKKNDKGKIKSFAQRKRIFIESDSDDDECNNIMVKKKKAIISDDE